MTSFGRLFNRSSLAFSDSFTSLKSKVSRYLRPPWISFEVLLLVPEAQSFFSRIRTFFPDSAACFAMAAPVIPPPIIAMS